MYLDSFTLPSYTKLKIKKLVDLRASKRFETVYKDYIATYVFATWFSEIITLLVKMRL